jgi:hypothetical protein
VSRIFESSERHCCREYGRRVGGGFRRGVFYE